jgi:hypothetical protein
MKKIVRSEDLTTQEKPLRELRAQLAACTDQQNLCFLHVSIE